VSGFNQYLSRQNFRFFYFFSLNVCEYFPIQAGVEAKPIFCLLRNIYDGVNDLVAVIDNDKCTGCETCVSECPASAISMENEKAKVDKDMCVDCQTCVDVCPSEAIRME